MQPIIFVVIATAFNRTNWLIHRSLLSVYRQAEVIPENIQVVIVDDNADPEEIHRIRSRVEVLRNELRFGSNMYATRVIRNERTRFRSGTGAWNTGIYHAFVEQPHSFVAILDDDDEYLPNHLSDCINEIIKNNEIDAVFQELEWRRPEQNSLYFPLRSEDITALNFYVGNPGVQGSNLVIRTETLVSIGAFDELLESTTDRDLIIRLIRYWQNNHHNMWRKKFHVIQRPGVIHYDHCEKRITADASKKKRGLDQFFKKYKLEFSIADYHKSLKRASFLFEYVAQSTMEKCIVILMAMHNNASTVEKAIRSIMIQRATQRALFLLVSDDSSTDGSYDIVNRLALEFSNIFLVKNRFGNVADNRNALQRKAMEIFPNAILFGRLDADDTLCEIDILQRIEILWDKVHFDVLVMANHQYLGDSFTGYTNRPSKQLLDKCQLVVRLQRMGEGEWEAELPSCNVFIRPEVAIPFAREQSAEDHRNLVDYLMQSERLSIHIEPSWVYCNYRIDGHFSASERSRLVKREARIKLHHYALTQYMPKVRIAETLLSQFKPGKYQLLGAGLSSVVFHDEEFVYKFFLPQNATSFPTNKYLVNRIRNIQEQFEGSKFFYPILDIIVFSEAKFILVYKYEHSDACMDFDVDEIQEFLVECWHRRLVFKDLKPENFIRVKGQLKWVDYEPDEFSDNLFLNMVARAFIYAQYRHFNKDFLTKLCRSAINNFDLPELRGLLFFANRVFAKAIWKVRKVEQLLTKPSAPTLIDEIGAISSSGTFLLPYTHHFNAETCFYQLRKKYFYLESIIPYNVRFDDENCFSPEKLLLTVKSFAQTSHKVSLVIKACVQDAGIIFQSVRHIVRQVSYPNCFEEVILALDIKEQDFLRQYDDNNTWDQLLIEAQRLKEEGLIDLYVFPEKLDVFAINQEWFGIDSGHTHTVEKVPVASSLFAFNIAKCDLILQMDCDVMIGRIDKSHSFLNDMIDILTSDERALSVGFNIYKGPGTKFTPYFGRENGGFVPEVRFCLLHKARIKSLLPLKNSAERDGLSLSWYRSLEAVQMQKGLFSLRGGDSRSFFIHPQNYRKTNRDVWFTIADRVEKLFVPVHQVDAVDLSGSFYDWTGPKRTEPMVLVYCFRNIALPRFLRYWYSLISQTYDNWGLIMIDDASENGLSYIIRELIRPYANQVTFIENRFQMGVAHNTHKAIHYFMSNPDSIVCVLDADDALIGSNSLQDIVDLYNERRADVVIGKMYRTDKLDAHYEYTPNFINPRTYGGNVWHHIHSFRRYLFESLDLSDLRIYNQRSYSDDMYRGKSFTQRLEFPEHCWSYAYMIPIVEMCKNPIWIDHFNTFHDGCIHNVSEIRESMNHIIAQIFAKPSKSVADVGIGRKTFRPNTDMIELDITYDCNLKCFHCNRSCTQAPTQTHMTLEQIKNFVADSIALNKKWRRINVLGGEPTLHPNFEEIVHCLLYEYLIPNSPQTIIQITSNGYGEFVQQKLSALPAHPNLIIDYNSFKGDRDVPYFSPFNLAPIDEPGGDSLEYHKGCWITSYCGIGLNYLGFFACGVAGGIERLTNSGKAILRLADLDERLLQDQLNTYCRFCGNFNAYAQNRGDYIERAKRDVAPEKAMSASWKRIYREFNSG